MKISRTRRSPVSGASPKLPFRFVVDYLSHLDPVVKPMFGCYAVYVGPKIMLILRQRSTHRSANGVWIATGREHHARLKILFPSMRSIGVLGKGETNWQMIPEGASDFEESVVHLCDLITRGDPCVGKIPASRRRRRKARSKSSQDMYRPDSGRI